MRTDVKTKYTYMKKLLILCLLVAPVVVNAQRLSRAYLGAQLHDFKSPGGSFVYSFAINQYIGVGPGLDAGVYKSETAFEEDKSSGIMSFYGDIRGKYDIGNCAPFIYGQGGYFVYDQDGKYVNQVATYQDVKRKGKYFYGGGIGVSYKVGVVGGFVSYTQRFYQFKYEPDNANINGRPLKDLVDNSASVGIVTAGIVF